MNVDTRIAEGSILANLAFILTFD